MLEQKGVKGDADEDGVEGTNYISLIKFFSMQTIIGQSFSD